MDGRQNSSDHAGRSDGRSGSDDVERARTSVKRWWQAAETAFRRAYVEPSSTPHEKHRREIQYALAVSSLNAARERFRRCQAAHGAVAPDAP